MKYHFLKNKWILALPILKNYFIKTNDVTLDYDKMTIDVLFAVTDYYKQYKGSKAKKDSEYILQLYEVINNY